MVDRSREDPNADPLDPLKDALEHGFSLIIFPEGTRSAQRLPGRSRAGSTTWRASSRRSN